MNGEQPLHHVAQDGFSTFHSLNIEWIKRPTRCLFWGFLSTSFAHCDRVNRRYIGTCAILRPSYIGFRRHSGEGRDSVPKTLWVTGPDRRIPGRTSTN